MLYAKILRQNLKNCYFKRFKGIKKRLKGECVNGRRFTGDTLAGRKYYNKFNGYIYNLK